MGVVTVTVHTTVTCVPYAYLMDLHKATARLFLRDTVALSGTQTDNLRITGTEESEIERVVDNLLETKLNTIECRNITNLWNKYYHLATVQVIRAGELAGVVSFDMQASSLSCPFSSESP